MGRPPASVEIRDVRGNVTIGDNNIVVSGDRSYVQVVRPGERPVPVAREDRTLLPRRPRSAVGRDRELDTLVRVLADDDAWQVHGPAGIGKSTLLRLAAHRIADDGGAVVFANATGCDAGDVLQDVFEACYDAPGYRPTPTELRRLMADVPVGVVIDDLEVAPEQLDTVLDTLQSSTLLYAGVRRTMHGEGRSLALGGLGHEDAVELLSRALGRSLEPAEEPVAEELWRVTSGAPLPLLHAVSEDRLSPAAELDGLLAELLSALTGAEREIVSVLALARDGGVSTTLLTELLSGVTGLPSVCDQLAARGLLVPTEGGHRLSPEVGGDLLVSLRPGPEALADLAARLTHWVGAPDADPAAVAADAGLLTAVVDAASQAGRASDAARLARAAAPVVACSLRIGVWGRVLERGIAAAERAGLSEVVAYLTHEDGVRKLVSGKRVAAAAAFTAAGALWRELGSSDHAAAADDAARSCGTDPASGADTSASPDPGTQADPGVSAGDPAAAGGDPGSAGDSLGDAVNETVQAVASPPVDPATTVAAAAKVGTVGTAKVVIGGGLATTVIAGGVVLAQQTDADTVPVQVTVATRVIEASMPGEREDGCTVGSGATDCTTLVNSKKGATGPVSVDPAQPLPAGVSLVYWGCDDGPQADSCRITADRDRRVCVTTTSPADEAARKRCAELTGSPAPTPVFRPLAWTAGGTIKVLTSPEGKPKPLATLGRGSEAGTVVWSQDATRVAWTETNTTTAEESGIALDTVKLRDLSTGKEQSWQCFACTIAFVDDDLVAGGSDITAYPADGGDPKDHDLPEIPQGLGHDGPPNTSVLGTWKDGRLTTYAQSAVPLETGERRLLTELSSPSKGRKVADLPEFGYPGVRNVSPDGTRVLFHPPAGQPPYNSCGEASYGMAVFDTASGETVVTQGPGTGWGIADTWFDTDGTAHVLYRRETGADAATCRFDAGGSPTHEVLKPEAGSWVRQKEETGRTVAFIGDRPVAHVARHGTLALVVTGDGGGRTLDTGVDQVFPSACY